MKLTRDVIKAEVKKGLQFPKANFGLRVGPGWPELVTEALKSETVQETIMADFAIAHIVGAQAMHRKTDPRELLSDPQFAEPFLHWLYIGIELGKQLAENEKLEEMFAKNEEPKE